MKIQLVCAMLAVGGCATTGLGSVETEVAKALISSDQENKLGLQFKTELETKQKVVYLNDPTVVEYVRGVANKVIALGKKDRPDVTWQVNVIDDNKTVNAFATPGGYLYVYSGLITAADNEAELAGVMAHETGHVVARHSARQMVDAYGLEAVAGLALGKDPGLLGQLAAGVGTKGFMLANSRSDETEADEYGARYAAGAGYDPHGLVTFFEKLKRQEGSSPAFLAILSDHPATPDRIDHTNQYIAQHKLHGATTNAPQFAAIKARVASHVSQSPPPSQAGVGPPNGGSSGSGNTGTSGTSGGGQMLAPHGSQSSGSKSPPPKFVPPPN
ncbi:MAG: peptidase Ste24p [Myxococcales bacterium]|nr:peptidase Ste24p [Myxococcales bacterium]